VDALARRHPGLEGLLPLGGRLHDVDGSGDRHLHRVEPPSARFHFRLEQRDAVADLLDRSELIEQEVIAELGDLLDRLRPAGPHPQRRMRLLRRGRLDHDVVELEVLAAMGPRAIGRPRLEHHLEALVEPLVGLFHRNAESGELVVPVALADAEVDPAAGEQVYGGDLLGQQHGVVPGQRNHRGAEPQRLGARADPREQVQGRGDLTEAGEVVLDDEGADVAERLGLHVVLDELPEAGPAVDVRAAPLGLSASEEPEPHQAAPFCWNHARSRCRRENSVGGIRLFVSNSSWCIDIVPSWRTCADPRI